MPERTATHGERDITAALSPREAQVLELAATGLTNGEIASRIQLSVHGVKFHLAHVYRKLGATNRTEAAVIYLRSSDPQANVRRGV